MDNTFVTCPYDPRHRMLKLRLQNHIVRCQKNFITAGMKPCPYNATHIIAKEKYGEHIQICPDIRLIEGHKYDDIHEIHGKLNEGAFHFGITQDKEWEIPEPDNATDTSSQTSESDGGKDNGQYFDLLTEYDEDEEPLQRYLYEEKKLERRSYDEASGTAGNNKKVRDSTSGKNCDLEYRALSDERLGQQYGGGRGRILKVLASLNM